MRQHQQHKHNNLGTIIARINYSMAKKTPSLAFWRNSNQPIQKKNGFTSLLDLGIIFIIVVNTTTAPTATRAFMNSGPIFHRKAWLSRLHRLSSKISCQYHHDITMIDAVYLNKSRSLQSPGRPEASVFTSS